MDAGQEPSQWLSPKKNHDDDCFLMSLCRAEGPCFPRVLRRTKGKREDESIVTHIVAERLTPSMIRDYSDDTAIQ